MKILYIVPFLQHPSLQGPTRHYHFIRELSKDHAITLLAPTRSQVTPDAIQEMARYTERLMTFDISKRPLSIAQGKSRALAVLGHRLERRRRFRSALREMKAAFQQLLERESFDLILFHGKGVYPIIEDHDDLPIVVDFCDATSLRIRGTMRYVSSRWLPILLWRFGQMRRLERKLIRKASQLAFITGRDRDAILGPNGKAEIVPNIVDLEYWTRRTNSPQPNCIMYSGGMEYRPAVDGALFLINRVLPLVRQSIPDIEVLIVGRDPTEELIATANRYPDVTVTGSVTDMRPYFERACVYACPLRIASGQQNKLIEAMAMEVPVVTTPVAAAGMRFDGAAEPPLVVADGATSLAEGITRILNSREAQVRLAVEGRRYIQNHFVAEHTMKLLRNMCLEAVRQWPTSAA